MYKAVIYNAYFQWNLKETISSDSPLCLPVIYWSWLSKLDGAGVSSKLLK